MSATVVDLAMRRSACLPQTGLVESGCGQGWWSTDPAVGKSDRMLRRHSLSVRERPSPGRPGSGESVVVRPFPGSLVSVVRVSKAESSITARRGLRNVAHNAQLVITESSSLIQGHGRGDEGTVAMTVGTTTLRRAVLRWRIMLMVLISA